MTKTDKINRQTLRVLSRDGRISIRDLAERVGLRRVQELGRAGVIIGHRELLNPPELGVGYVGVGVGEHSKAAHEGFEQALQQAPEVAECHNVTDTIEYLLRVECDDLCAYKTFHTEVLGTLPHVTSITSYVVIDSRKDMRASAANCEG